MDKKCVLVTGAAGFIGSHIVARCLENDFYVYGIDNFISSDENSRHHLKNVENDKYYFVDGDISVKNEVKYLESQIRNLGIKPEIIFNFACPASPPTYQMYSFETIDVCTKGVDNIMSLARDYEAHVIHASTSEIYGDPDVSPQPENYRGRVNTWGPRACYDEGKRMAESIIWEWRDKVKVNASVIRIFNTYGPHMDMDDGRVITNFIKSIMNEKPLTIYGDGNQTRSFCYVDDLVDAIMLVAEKPLGDKGPINLGNPHEFTIKDLVDFMKETIKPEKFDVSYHPLPTDDPTQRCPDIFKAQTHLDWEPKIDIKEGIKRMYEYMVNNHTKD